MVFPMLVSSHHIDNFPLVLAEVSRPWLASVFKVSVDDLLDFRVTAPKLNRGYGSKVGFISLNWAPGVRTQGLPATLAIKVMPEYLATADMVQQRRTFCREARFYAELAAQTPVRMPKVYAALWNDETGNAVLLLQDCSVMRRFSFFDPPRFKALARVIDTAARLHGHWWQREAELVASEAVMGPTHAVWTQWASEMANSWSAWLESPLAAFLPVDWRGLCIDIAATAEKRMTTDWPTRNLTLCHMDFHCQNVFFDQAKISDPIVIFDWDGCHLGCGAHDIAYFLGLLPLTLRRQVETPLLHRYHRRLLQAGVRDYDFASLKADYAFGCLFNTFLIPMQLALDLSQPQAQADAERMVVGLLQMVLDNQEETLK